MSWYVMACIMYGVGEVDDLAEVRRSGRMRGGGNVREKFAENVGDLGGRARRLVRHYRENMMMELDVET